MDFSKAKDAFRENLRLLGDPKRDQLAWNLNTGLLGLVEDLQSRLAKMDRELANLQHKIQQLK